MKMIKEFKTTGDKKVLINLLNVSSVVESDNGVAIVNIGGFNHYLQISYTDMKDLLVGVVNTNNDNNLLYTREDLVKNEEDGWHRFTSHHWRRQLKDGNLDYWPSTGKVLFQKQIYHINDDYIQQLLK